MRWLLPLLLACCTTGCGGCVDEPEQPAPGSSAPSVSHNLPNPVLGVHRPHLMHFGQGVDEGGVQHAGDTE